MARRFLTHLDMTGNQLLNVTLEKLSSAPLSGNFEGRMYYNTSDDLIYVYNGAAWTAVGSVLSITGTANEVDVSASTGAVTISLPSTINANTTGNASTATTLQTARTIALGGDLSGSASFDGSASVTISATIQPNSVALGTDTNGNYVASVSASDGISASGTGESASVTLTNTDKGSSQNIFKTISGDTGSFSAGSNSASVTIAGNSGITTSASAGIITIDNDGVLSVSGTTNQISASTVSGATTLSLPNSVIFPGSVTLNADPQNSLEAATKQYVDNVAQGLHIHAPSKAATTASLGSITGGSVTYNNGSSGVGATLTLGVALTILDGYTLQNGDRIIVKNESNAAHNGIYTWATGGTILTRAIDFNTPTEMGGGDFTFVQNGTLYNDTGWVMTDPVTTVGTSAVNFAQFSGAGTYTAGNGLTLTGTSFSINTGITADLSTLQTLTNKTLTSPTITNPTVSGLYLSDNNIIVEGTNDTNETTLIFTDPTQDNTITFKNASGTLAFTSDIPADLTRKFSASVGNNSATSFAVTHNLNTRDVIVNVYDNATYDTVETDVVRTNANTVTVSFSAVPTNNAYRVVVIG